MQQSDVVQQSALSTGESPPDATALFIQEDTANGSEGTAKFAAALPCKVYSSPTVKMQSSLHHLFSHICEQPDELTTHMEDCQWPELN